MQFSQNHITNYGASFKAKNNVALTKMPKILLLVQICLIYQLLRQKAIFQNSALQQWQNVLLQKIKKTHRVDPEKNVPQIDRQTDINI